MASLKTWFEQHLARVSAKAPIAEEIRYGLKRCNGLTRFLDNGRIELDGTASVVQSPSIEHDNEGDCSLAIL